MPEHLLIALLAPIAAGGFVPLLARAVGRRVGWLVLLVPALLFAYFASFLGSVDAAYIRHTWSWVPTLGIELSLALDGLSLLFALLITGIGTLVVFYAQYYMSPDDDLGKFYMYILLFMGAMLGVVLVDNLIVLYIFWELTSISSFLLIGFWHTRGEAREGALKAILITVMGGLGLLAGFALLYAAGGTYDFRELVARKDAIVSSPYYVPAVLLIFLGAFTKSAQAPFHIWLPGAMAAPTPVSAYLHSATMVKAGIFLVAKLSLLLGGTPLWFYTVAAFGTATLLVGGLLALRQIDLKALLACSTVSQLGLIIPMFGMGTELAALAGAAHIIHHATFKGALFMLVGIIDHETYTRRIDNLAGLFRRMPKTSILIAIAALSMAGLWPLNGFVSKELIFDAHLHPPFGSNFWTGLFAVLATVGSIATTAYSLVLVHHILFGRVLKKAHDLREGVVDNEFLRRAHDPVLPMLLAPAVLVVLVIILGIYPFPLEEPLYRAAAAASLGYMPSTHLHTMPALGLPLLMSVLALALGALLYLRIGAIRYVLARTRRAFSANAAYEGFLQVLHGSSERLDRAHMTGFLRDYVLFTVGAFVLLVGYGVVRALFGGLRLDLAPVTPWEIGVTLALSVGAIATVIFHQRMSALIAAGSVGALVSLLFVLWHAPDLALTQLMVEAISALLILLAFTHLPQVRREFVPARYRRTNIAVAVAFGLLSSLAAAVSLGNPYFETISHYFVENSLPLGGGRNIVNVILVDFRGFDTMGEITVMAIAALGVRAIVRLRRKPEKEPEP